MIDTLIYQGLTEDNLSDFLFSTDGWRVYPNGMLGVEGVPARPDYPFIQHGDGGANTVASIRETRHSLVMYWDVFAYDTPGSFLRVKTILDIIKDNLEGKAGQVASNGWRATEIVHTSYSPDGYDPVRQQVTKRATFKVVASRTP